MADEIDKMCEQMGISRDSYNKAQRWMAEDAVRSSKFNQVRLSKSEKDWCEKKGYDVISYAKDKHQKGNLYMVYLLERILRKVDPGALI